MITNQRQFSISNLMACLHLGTSCAARLLLPLLLLALPAVLQALDYTYTNKNGTITITKYMGSGGALDIPSTIDGLPVTRIGYQSFYFCTNLTSVTIPDSVTSIEKNAFNYCYGLTGVYFKGNAPSVSVYSEVFYNANNATVYYLPGTTGWRWTFAYRPAKLWNSHIQTSDATFGVGSNFFGFNLSGTSGPTIVVEACTDLANPKSQNIYLTYLLLF